MLQLLIRAHADRALALVPVLVLVRYPRWGCHPVPYTTHPPCMTPPSNPHHSFRVRGVTAGDITDSPTSSTLTRAVSMYVDSSFQMPGFLRERSASLYPQPEDEAAQLSPMLSRRSCFMSPAHSEGHYQIGKGERRMLDCEPKRGKGKTLQRCKKNVEKAS